MSPNRQDAELERLRLSCGVNSIEAVPKAQEFLRRMESKCRPGALGKGEPCRTLIAFDLACRSLGCPVPHKIAVKISGTPDAVYLAALGTAQRLLGVQRRYTCQEIAQAVGGARVGIKATSELQRYKEKFLASYPARQAASIDLDSTVYAVAAFYLCARKLKHPVNKQRLLELSLVREAEFTSVCRSMLELCYSTLGVSISDKPSAERLQHFKKTSALNSINAAGQSSSVVNHTTPGASTTTATAGAAAVTTATLKPAAETSSGNKASRVGTTSGGIGSGSSIINKRKDRGSSSDAAGSAGRRTIPLTRLVGPGGAPMNHVAALARSIQAAAGRRRSGGATVAAVEPGGNNDKNNSLNDRTHRVAQAKRPRPNTSTSTAAAATVATGVGSGSRGGPSTTSASATTGSTAAVATAAATATRTSAGAGTALPPSSVPRVPRAPMVNPYATARTTTTTATAIRRPMGCGGHGGTDGAGMTSEAPPGTVTATAATPTTAAATVSTTTATAAAVATRTSADAALPLSSVSRAHRAPVVNPYAAARETTAAATIRRAAERDSSNNVGANASADSGPKTPSPPPPSSTGGNEPGHERTLPLPDAAMQGEAVNVRGGGDLPLPATRITSREGDGGGDSNSVNASNSCSSVPPVRGEGLVPSRQRMRGDGSDSGGAHVGGGRITRQGPTGGGGGGDGGGGDDSRAPKGRSSLRGEGRGEEWGRGQGHGHAEWKNRVLASMENRMRSAAAGSAAAVVGGGDRCLSALATGSAGAPVSAAAIANAIDDANAGPGANANADPNSNADADGSSRRGASPAAVKSTKQASLTSFFAHSARGEENENI